MSRIAAVFRGVSRLGFGALLVGIQALIGAWPLSITARQERQRCEPDPGLHSPSSQAWSKFRTGLFRDPVRLWGGCTHSGFLQS